MPDRSMRSRSWHPAQKAQSESAKEHQKQANIIIGVISFAHKKCKTGAIGAARSSKKVRNVRTGRPQPRRIMPDRSMRSRSWQPAQKAQPESAKEHQKQATKQQSVSFPSHTKSTKQVPWEPPDRHKRCATCARAVRSPDASCLIVACAVAAGIQRRKRTPNQQRSTKSRPPNNRVISFAHKKCKTGAIGAARSSRKGRNVRTARP